MLPVNFIQTIQHINGFDREGFEAVHTNSNPITSIRLNDEKVCNNLSYLYQQQVPWCNHAYYLKERPSFTLEPSFHAGAFYVQEASSMFLWHIIKQLYANNTEKKVLDVCAAPGGKSTLLASYFKNGLIVSNEIIKSRAAILVENLSKWGTGNFIVSNNDPKQFANLTAFFDAVVIDAPCSGSGMFRKDKTAVDEWSLQNVKLCSQRQQRIIANVMPALKENGYLIYSTCSYSEEENEQILDFIADNFSVESVEININPSWGIVSTKSNKHKAIGYRFFPDKIKGEGFFIAVFKKNEFSKNNKFSLQLLSKLTSVENELIKNFITSTIDKKFFKHNNEIKCINTAFYADVEKLANLLYLKKVGTIIGEVKGKDFVPHHELAISNISLSNIATLELNKEDALKFLAKKELDINTNKGLTLITFNGLGLGWIKVLHNRINNYYPNEWRILNI